MITYVQTVLFAGKQVEAAFAGPIKACQKAATGLAKEQATFVETCGVWEAEMMNQFLTGQTTEEEHKATLKSIEKKLRDDDSAFKALNTATVTLRRLIASLDKSGIKVKGVAADTVKTTGFWQRWQ